MMDGTWLADRLRRNARLNKTRRGNKSRRGALGFSPLAEGRRAMAIESLEGRSLLSAAPTTFYVANSFYDQTTAANTATPAVGDLVNWLASGPFAEVDGLKFGVNAFTSIQAAVNAAASGDTIDVATGTYIENIEISQPVSLVGAGVQTVLHASQVPGATLGVGVAINAAAGTTSIAGFTIDGFRTGVNVDSGAAAMLSNDTISNSLGSGIFNSGALTLVDSSLVHNQGGTQGAGGGLDNGGTATVIASTFAENFAIRGGGIYNIGTLTVSDSTFSGNLANVAGGGISNRSILTINSSTITGNTAGTLQGGGLDNPSFANVANTIIAGNRVTGANAVDPDVYGAFAATDHDLIGVLGDATGFATTGATASVIVGSDDAATIGLGPLADNGGPTQTIALLPGGLAINGGQASPGAPFAVSALDQRGQPRTSNGTLDIGAYETAPLTSYVANSFYDQTLGQTTSAPNLGDVVNWLASGPFAEVDGLTFGLNAFTSIQAAANVGSRTVDVAAGTYSENVVLARPVSLVGAGSQSVLEATLGAGIGVSINSPAGSTSIEGFTIEGFQTGVSVDKLATAALANDTISNGVGTGISNNGVLTLSESRVLNNQGGTLGGGGGLLNSGTATVIASLFSGNFANVGGGIYNFGTLTVSDSTLTANSALLAGGGIENNGTLTVDSSTLSGNTAKTQGGGGIFNLRIASVANSIIAGNSVTGANAVDPDVSGVYAATDHDLIGVLGDATGFATTGSTASIILNSDDAATIGLAPLADNGGPTQTIALLPGSLAINAGNVSPAAPFAVPVTDQRGQARVVNGMLDIGAFQIAPTTIAVQNISATEGASTGLITVATFTAAASDFAATINWGDGQSSVGSVTGSVAAGFTISASHTYAEQGIYAVSVSLADPSVSASAAGTATVSDPQVLISTLPAHFVEASATTVNVATFTDPGGAEPIGEYSVTIDWGDNSP